LRLQNVLNPTNPTDMAYSEHNFYDICTKLLDKFGETPTDYMNVLQLE